MSVNEKLKAAKSVVDTPHLFIASGFDVNFVGPDEIPTECGVCGQDSAPMDEELGSPSYEKMFVDEKTFVTWMDSSKFTVGRKVQDWWSELHAGAEHEVDALKTGDDETSADLFRRICDDLQGEDSKNDDNGEKNVVQRSAVESAKESIIALPALVQWLEERLGTAMGLDIAPSW